MLFSIGAGWFLSIGVRVTYPVLIPHLQVAYGITLSTAGLLLTTLWVAYAFGQLPGGMLGDLIGEGRTLSISTVIAAVMLAFVTVGGSGVLLFVSTFSFGFATALFGVVHLNALADLFPENPGAAIGVTSAAGDVGNMAIPPIAGLLATWITWQFGFGFVVPLFLLVGATLWAVLPAQTSGTVNKNPVLSPEMRAKLTSTLREPEILYIIGIQILGVSIWQAFTGFYPTYLMEIKGLSGPLASGLFALFFAFGVVIRPLSGKAYDLFGARSTLLFLMSLTAIGLAVLPYVNGIWSIVVVTAIISSMLGRGTITLSFMTSQLPSSIQNIGLGSIRTVYISVSAASPALFGFIAGRGYFDEAFLVLAGVTAICIAIITRLPKQHNFI